eukprot:TRINITY_DN2143_c0_g2_i13.p1 TRINITY_DN2143_c0_g2~~TRINITY_DN2143_c0_g2_i13.p1  ORF type:complete len:610 (-),score=66.62 TRINITY_DN2143_c0_g2_i13:181-1926(-)
MADEEMTTATGSVTVNIKVSTGQKYTVAAPVEATVAEFKELLSKTTEVPAEQQRLIFAGRVLKDHETLASYGIKDGLTVHMVRSAPPPATPSTPTGATGTPFATSPMASLQQQLLQNPEFSRALFDSPMMRTIMDDPALLRSMLLSNPQMREVMERNPEVAHALNDPATLREMMRAIRNPEAMRQMQRSHDRALHNISSIPGGFNALRRMYHTIQKPLTEASRTSPSSSTTSPTSTPPIIETPTPTTAPVPNPWSSSPGPAPTGAAPDPFAAFSGFGGAAGASAGAAPAPNPFAAFAGMGGMPGMGGMGGMPGMGAGAGFGAPPPMGGMPGAPGANPFGLTPAQVMQMMQNPMVQNTMRQLFSNPGMMEHLVNSHPMLQQMMAANPAARTMLQNPAFLQSLSNPQTLAAMMQMQQAMSTLSGAGLAPGFGTGGFAPAAAPAPGSPTTDASASTSTAAPSAGASTAGTETPGAGTAGASAGAAGTAPAPNPFAAMFGAGELPLLPILSPPCLVLEDLALPLQPEPPELLLVDLPPTLSPCSACPECPTECMMAVALDSQDLVLLALLQPLPPFLLLSVLPLS